MAFRPKFDKYYQGIWEHASHAGVGLKFSGYPTQIEPFLDLLHQHSCHPVATRRILDELKTKGVKYTTLMAHLNFDYIGDKLKDIGVTMEIVPPIDSSKLQKSELDSIAFSLFKKEIVSLDDFKIDDDEKTEVLTRFNLFRDSFKETEHHFGPYDEKREIVKTHIKIAQKSYD